MREDDGVKYGGLQRSGDEGFLAAAHEVCISNLFLSLMLGIRVLSGKKNLLDISIDSNQAVPESIARIILK